MHGGLEGKVALVTGAGSGIGRASALALANAGAAVVATDVSLAAADTTVELIVGVGGRASATPCDVAIEGDVASAIDHARVTFGGLHVALNNAGIDGDVNRRLADQSVDNWARVLSVNLTGVFLCMKHELLAMLEAGAGSIVNIASIAGLRGFAKAAPYGASKHGVVGLTRAAALDYATKNIRVNAVCPGAIETAMLSDARRDNPAMVDGLSASTPMRRLGTPEEVAALVVWLCSDAASYVTGQCIAVDGGFVASG